MKGVIWIIGILLLVGTAWGAKLALDQSSTGPATNKVGEDSKKPPEFIECWGHFDVEKGVTILFPKQAGDIVMVKPEYTRVNDRWESTKVKEGDVLLQVRDDMAQLTVKAARWDIVAGERQVDEARLLTQQYELQREQQEAGIRSLDSEMKRVALEKKSKLDQLEPEQPIRKTLEEMYGEALKQLAEKKKAEQSKLKQLELLNAKLKIDQAEAELGAKKVRLEQAIELVKQFQIVAPSDGTMLRTYVKKGETLGPVPRSQAIDFLPDGDVIVRAEVLQEWGRYVKEGQTVEIEDDTYHGPNWTGKIRSLSSWYAPTRSPVIEPFRQNDVRTLECIIEVTGGDTKKLNGQRIRAKIKI